MNIQVVVPKLRHIKCIVLRSA